MCSSMILACLELKMCAARGGSRITEGRGHVRKACAKIFRPCPQIVDHAPLVAIWSVLAPASWLWLSHL